MRFSYKKGRQFSTYTYTQKYLIVRFILIRTNNTDSRLELYNLFENESWLSKVKIIIHFQTEKSYKFVFIFFFFIIIYN